MKSFFGFAPFVIALLLCLSITLTIAKNFDGYECSTEINATKDLIKLCPKLSVGHGISSHLTKAVVDISLSILGQCANIVDRFCDSLPHLLQTYIVGGSTFCKAYLKKNLCDRVNDELNDIYCYYKYVIGEILKLSDKWSEIAKDKESEVCSLFEANPILCSVAKRRLCEGLPNMPLKSHCHHIVSKDIENC